MDVWVLNGYALLLYFSYCIILYVYLMYNTSRLIQFVFLKYIYDCFFYNKNTHMIVSDL
jgi:hypothetical protein